MSFQTVFKRYELKYVLTLEQKELIMQNLSWHMHPDKYGKTTVQNLYFDTDTYRLIRRSIEKPVYKEKLRVRSYGRTTPSSTVFVELKKKYEHVVYKRRLPLCESEAMAWLLRESAAPIRSQISGEIDYVVDFYGGLRPSVFLSYDREAYFDKTNKTFRVTFDENILYRSTDLSLCSPAYGTSLLPTDHVLMELKSAQGIPLWMVDILSRERIYKTSFSKYGTAYQTWIAPNFIKSIINKENQPYGNNF